MANSIMMLIKGDMLVEHERIESGSVDLILTDLPYGTMKGIAVGDTSWGNTNTEWDSAMEPGEVFAIANRILRKNGKLVLFSQEPYSSRLITEAIPNVPFNYRMSWEKDIYGNALFAKKAPLIFYEDIIVFSKTHSKHDFEGKHPLRPYFAEVLTHIGTTKKAIIDAIGQRADHVFRTNSTQFSLCTEETYLDLVTTYGIDKITGYMPFVDLKAIDTAYRSELIVSMNEANPPIFNLPEGAKYKSNILRYCKDYGGHHPTQKPVALLDDLIRTYSNEGDLVADLTMGSGSTGVAAAESGRGFVGIEMDEGYYDIAVKRVNGEL